MLIRSNILLLFGIFFLFIVGCGNEQSQQDQGEKQKKNNQHTPVQEQQNENTNHTEEKEKSKEKTVEYRNEEYGFTLQIPASWEGKYEVEKSNADPNAEATFFFTYKAEEADLFSIVILNITKEEWNRDYVGGLLEYVGEKDGKIYAYSVPSELPNELAQDKKEKIHSLIDVTQMINVDVPRIVKTFKLLH